MYNFKSFNLDQLTLILFCLFPLSILFGNFLINFFILIISSVFLYQLKKGQTNLFFYKECSYLFYLLLFFFLSLCVNLIFSNNVGLSYPRVLKIFFIIFFIISFKSLIIKQSENLDRLFKIWSMFFLIVTIDIIIEFIFGKNIIGYETKMYGRLGSFTGEESTIGHFFLGFSLVFLSYIYTKSKNKFLNLSLAIFLIIIAFLTGERASFIKIFLAITIFNIFALRLNLKLVLTFLFLILIIFFIIFQNLNNSYKQRYINQLDLFDNKFSLSKYLENSFYGAHRNVAKEIFLDNPIFGVGVKNFRIESRDKKYDNLDHKYNAARGSTHPHELYYEFLSETGIFGLTCFLIFILSSIILSLKNFIKTKNIYQFSGIVVVSLSILPIIPTGSYLSTYFSSVFWINYALMMGYNNYKNIKY